MGLAAEQDGTGYVDEVTKVISSGESSTTALAGSTEAAQFSRHDLEEMMEDIRSYRMDNEEKIREEERVERAAAAAEDEIPFHIPRD